MITRFNRRSLFGLVVGALVPVAKLDPAIVDSFGIEMRDVVVARLNERIAPGL